MLPQKRPTLITTRLDFNPPLIATLIKEADLVSVRNRKRAEPLGPFDNHHRLRLGEHLIQPKIIYLINSALDPIEVEVIEREPPVVTIDEGKSWAVDFSRINLQAGANALSENGLARAEVALEQEDCRLRDGLTDSVSKLEGLFGRVGNEFSR